MFAWYFYDWTGTYKILQEELIPKLVNISGLVFDDDMNPLTIPNRPRWLDELFLISASRPRPNRCVVL